MWIVSNFVITLCLVAISCHNWNSLHDIKKDLMRSLNLKPIWKQEPSPSKANIEIKPLYATTTRRTTTTPLINENHDIERETLTELRRDVKNTLVMTRKLVIETVHYFQKHINDTLLRLRKDVNHTLFEIYEDLVNNVKNVKPEPAELKLKELEHSNKRELKIFDREFFSEESSDANPITNSASSRHRFINTIDYSIDSKSGKILDDRVTAEDEKMHIKTYCRYFKNGTKIDIEKMPDVWEVVYYRLHKDIPCFRIHVNKITIADKKSYSKAYLKFKDRIDWNSTHLKIQTASAEQDARQHFLQEINEYGVMDNNIIVEKHTGDGVLVPELLDESPNQWMIMNNLLLMRDCDTGNIVVFSRVPSIPKNEEIANTLKIFGETFDKRQLCTVRLGICVK